MNSRVFAIDIHNVPGYQGIWFYRTNGLPKGGLLRMYKMTPSRLIRLLRAMVNVSSRVSCRNRLSDGVTGWAVDQVIQETRARRVALERAS